MLQLEDAQQVAEDLRLALWPQCERIEIAGSIRRECRHVGDIELVAIPRYGKATRAGELFSCDNANLLKLRLETLIDGGAEIQVIKPGTPKDERQSWRLTEDGKYWRLYLPKVRTTVDLFLCSAETWGLTMALRTGPADFSKGLVQRWKSLGGTFKKARMIDRLKRKVPVPEEEDVFRHMWIHWVEPQNRFDATDIAGREASA